MEKVHWTVAQPLFHATEGVQALSETRFPAFQTGSRGRRYKQFQRWLCAACVGRQAFEHFLRTSEPDGNRLSLSATVLMSVADPAVDEESAGGAGWSALTRKLTRPN